MTFAVIEAAADPAKPRPKAATCHRERSDAMDRAE
jgi:hypothetical protein